MRQGTCSIEDCERPILCRGWCSMHYQRWRTHGDPEGPPRWSALPAIQYPDGSIGITLVNNRGVLIIDQSDYDLVAPYRWYLNQDLYVAYARAGQHRDGTNVLAHRLITAAPLDLEVDHANGNGLDCRRANLRIATPQQNRWNRYLRQGGVSQYFGVSWHRRIGKWQAQMQIEGKRKSLGYFTDEVEAAKAYDCAAFQHRGEFAYLNFPLSQPA